MKIKTIDIKIVRGDSTGLPVMPTDANEVTVRAWYAAIIRQAAAGGNPAVTLSTGVRAGAAFPLTACAKIMSQEVLRAAREGRGGLREIIICLDSAEAFQVFEKQVFGYLRHMTEDLGWGPYVTTDAIIEVAGGIILIERSNPPFGWALPGGFVDNGESLEEAVRREAREETGLELDGLKQFHTYSDPGRDPRFYTVTTVFTASGRGVPRAGDDAKGLKVVPLSESCKMGLAFDHNRVIADYLLTRGL